MNTDFEIFLQAESTTILEQLVQDFLPDETCPMGPQLFTETPGQVYQSGREDNKSRDEVINLHPISFYLFIYLYLDSHDLLFRCTVASFTFNGR